MSWRRCAPAVAAALLVAPACARAAVVRLADDAVLVRNAPAGGVLFSLDDVAVARDLVPPYRLALRTARGASPRVPRTVEVRALRDGRLLGRAVVLLPAPADPAWPPATGAPAPLLATRPAGATPARLALVGWSVASAVAVPTACSLDGAPARPCASPLLSPSLAAGAHTLQITARSAAGAATTVVRWRVVPWRGRARLRLAVLDRPATSTRARTAAFSFESSGARVTTCALDGARPAPCTSPLVVAGLAPGRHVLRVAARGRGGARSRVQVTWAVLPAPLPGVGVGPAAAAAPTIALAAPPTHVDRADLEVAWRATGATEVVCALDAAAAAPCASPLVLRGLAIGAHVLALTASGPGGTATATASFTVDPAPPCGTAAQGPATYDHVVWIVLENHGSAQATDPRSAPYTAGLAEACGLATNYLAVTHPSLPNYIALTSGGTQGVTDDRGPSSHPLAAANIFSQVGDWRALEDGMPAPCARTDTYPYATRHNPAVFYTGLAASCAARDVPLAAVPDVSARFTFVTPDLCHDTHDCAVSVGDAWLAAFVPSVLASPEYRAGRTALFLTWDENDGSGPNRVATIVVAPSVPAGTTSATAFDHYGLLRTTEELLGIGTYLGAASRAASMRAAFGL